MPNWDIEARLRTGRQLAGVGFTVLAAVLIGTCGAAMEGAGRGDSALRGIEIGQSPWLLVGMTISITLIVLGLVRQANARRDAKQQYLEQHTTVELDLADEQPDGPFRGHMKEVEVLDPLVAAAEQAEREGHRRRGGVYLAVGGAIMLLTIVGLLSYSSGDSGGSARRAVDRVLTALGLSIFPFGLGLFFAIKGLLLRSR